MTVPVGVPAPGAFALTVAAKITGWPKTEGLLDEMRVVVVSALFTVCVKAGALVLVGVAVDEVRPLPSGSAPYTAVMGWLLRVNVEIVSGACPELRLTVANGVARSLKVIVPVAEAGETVAVKVTGWLYTEGFSE